MRAAPGQGRLEDLARVAHPKLRFEELLRHALDVDSEMPPALRHQTLAVRALLRGDEDLLRDRLDDALAAEGSPDRLDLATGVCKAAYRVGPLQDVRAMVPAVMAWEGGRHPNQIRLTRVQAALTLGADHVLEGSDPAAGLERRQVVLGRRAPGHAGLPGAGTFELEADGVPAAEGPRSTRLFQDEAAAREHVETTIRGWDRSASQSSRLRVHRLRWCVFTALKPVPMYERHGQLVAIGDTLEIYHHARWVGQTLARRPVEDVAEATVLPRVGYGNFYHRLVDSVATLLALEAAGHLRDRVYVGDDLMQFAALLSRVGIDPSRLTRYDGDAAIRVRDADVVSIATNARTKVALARRTIGRLGPPSGERVPIYISRRRAQRRPLVNEEAVERIAVEEGYSVVYPEELTLEEQVELARRASVIAGPHGAGLSLSLFAQDGLRMVELMPDFYIVDFFYRLANRCGYEYSVGVGEAAPGADQPFAWRVDPDVLRRALAYAVR